MTKDAKQRRTLPKPDKRYEETFEKFPYFVIPAKAGIQKILKRLDSRLRGNNNLDHMRRNSKVSRRIFRLSSNVARSGSIKKGEVSQISIGIFMSVW